MPESPQTVCTVQLLYQYYKNVVLKCSAGVVQTEASCSTHNMKTFAKKLIKVAFTHINGNIAQPSSTDR